MVNKIKKYGEIIIIIIGVILKVIGSIIKIVIVIIMVKVIIININNGIGKDWI